MVAVRLQRQHQFIWRVSITFLLFCAFAAPIQFHVEWYRLWSHRDSSWMGKALSTGPLYFYAVILCIEAFLRLEHFPKLVNHDNRIWFLRLFLLVPIVVFVLQFLISPHYATGAPIALEERYVQFLTGLTSFILATLVHWIITRQEVRRIL